MSAAVLNQYLFAPVRVHERRTTYRSMRVLMVVSSFCAGMPRMMVRRSVRRRWAARRSSVDMTRNCSS